MSLSARVFTMMKFYKALSWLEKLAALQETGHQSAICKGTATVILTRIYTHDEAMCVIDSLNVRGFLMFLEQIIDSWILLLVKCS